MRQIFTENRPGLMILMMVLMVSAGSLTVGAMMWSERGLDDSALMLLLFGAIVAIFVIVGIAISLASESFYRDTVNLPFSDRPPKYRDTWRRQHLESCSQATDTFPAAASPGTGRRGTDTSILRLDVRNLWPSLGVPGVHGNARRATTACVITEHTQREATRAGRAVRANTCCVLSDEGLPTYNEAMGK